MRRKTRITVESLESRSLMTHWYPMGMVGPVPAGSEFYSGSAPGIITPMTAAPPPIYLSTGSTNLYVGSRFGVAVASTDPAYKFAAVTWKAVGPGNIVPTTPAPTFNVNSSSSTITGGSTQTWDGVTNPYPGIATWGAYFGATPGKYTIEVNSTYSDGTKPPEVDLQFTITAPTVEYVKVTGSKDNFGTPSWKAGYIGFYHASQIDGVGLSGKIDLNPAGAYGGAYGFVQIVKKSTVVYTGTKYNTTITYPASPAILDDNGSTPFLDNYTVSSIQIQTNTLTIGGTGSRPGTSPTVLQTSGTSADGNKWIGFSQTTTYDTYLVYQSGNVIEATGLAVAIGKVEWTENNTATLNQTTGVWTTSLNHPTDNWVVNGSGIAPTLLFWAMNSDTANSQYAVTINH